MLKSRSQWKYSCSMNGRQMDSEDFNIQTRKNTKHRAPTIKMELPTYSSRGRNTPTRPNCMKSAHSYCHLLADSSSKSAAVSVQFPFLISCFLTASSLCAYIVLFNHKTCLYNTNSRAITLSMEMNNNWLWLRNDYQSHLGAKVWPPHKAENLTVIWADCLENVGASMAYYREFFSPFT
jgi:hypothetical protein